MPHIRLTSNAGLANLAKAPRCGARTRAGHPCKQAAVSGRARCRMHGGAKGSGGPRGHRNGNFKHGLWTIEGREMRQAVRVRIRETRALIHEMKHILSCDRTAQDRPPSFVIGFRQTAMLPALLPMKERPESAPEDLAIGSDGGKIGTVHRACLNDADCPGVRSLIARGEADYSVPPDAWGRVSNFDYLPSPNADVVASYRMQAVAVGQEQNSPTTRQTSSTRREATEEIAG